MRFADFLKTTVLLSAGAASVLALVTVLAGGAKSDGALVLISAGWWVVAALIGLRLGRRAEANPPIARLLAGEPVTAAVYVGDDRTDLDAFRGLRSLAQSGTLSAVVCVAVSSEEAPQELAAEADLTVDGTAGVRGLLEALL